MDQKLAALSALSLLAQDGTLISEDTLRHLRTILSVYVQEIFSEDEYQQLIETLQDEAHIHRQGEKVTVTGSGLALVQAIGERILGQTDFERLGRMIKDYTRDGGKYVQRLQEQLKALEKARESKTQAVSSSWIRTVGLIIKIQHKYTDLVVSQFKLDQQLMRNEDALRNEVNYVADRYIRSNGQPIVTHVQDGFLEIIGFGQISSFTLFGQDLQVSAAERLRREDVSDWNLLIATAFMEYCLRELGYVRSSWPGRTFTKYCDAVEVSTNVGVVRECESLNLDFTELKGDQVLVWIESFESPRKRAIDFLRENIKNMGDADEMQACLSDLKLRSIPSGSEVTLKSILPDSDMMLETVPGTGQTLASYWDQTHRIVLAERTQPILVVDGKNNELNYPAEMIYIDRYSLEKRLGQHQVRRPRTEGPKDRYRRLQDLFYSLKRVPSGRLSRYLDIDLPRYAPTAAELLKLGAIQGAARVRPPLLEFNSGLVSLDPMDIFLPEYVPVCGRKNLAVTHLVSPGNVTKQQAETLIQRLHQQFSKYGFGQIHRSANLQIIQYDTSADRSELESKIRDLGRVDRHNNIALAIVPDDNDDCYYSLKRMLPSRVGVPLQCVRISSFDEIVAGNFQGLEVLCIKLLIKSLEEGESIWNLCSAAGLSTEKALFVGIGFSRYPREGRVSKCAAVLHDARGARVSWKVFSTPQERTITRQWFDTLLRRIRDTIEKEKPSRLVFYRTGTMYTQELDAVTRSLEGQAWLSTLKVSFVSVMDAGNYRFYLYDSNTRRYRNAPVGYALTVSDKEALLSTSTYDDRELRQGTIIPVHLKVEIGSEDILDVVKEYHDLTYLNWRAPLVTGKHPLVLTLAERFAELTREGVSAESMFYLDL